MIMTEKIAVLLPAYNEEVTIQKVIKDFQKVLPEADIYVYDNNSKDKTNELAREAGAIVRFEPRPVSYTHLTLPTIISVCRSRWSPYH